MNRFMSDDVVCYLVWRASETCAHLCDDAATKPQTLAEAHALAYRLLNLAVREGAEVFITQSPTEILVTVRTTLGGLSTQESTHVLETALAAACSRWLLKLAACAPERFPQNP